MHWNGRNNCAPHQNKQPHDFFTFISRSSLLHQQFIIFKHNKTSLNTHHPFVDNKRTALSIVVNMFLLHKVHKIGTTLCVIFLMKELFALVFINYYCLIIDCSFLSNPHVYTQNEYLQIMKDFILYLFLIVIFFDYSLVSKT